MSPFGVPEEEIKHLPKDLQKVLTSYLKHASDRYYRMRNTLIVFACLLTLGAASGIWAVNDLSNARHADVVQTQQEQCWSTFNGRTVLRAIVESTGSSKIDPTLIQNPELRAILVQSNAQGKVFKKEAFKLLKVPNCVGSNPDPVSTKVLKEAQIKAKQ